MKKFAGTVFSVLAGVIFFVCSVATADALELGARAYYWFPTFKSDLRVDDNIRGTEVNVKDVLSVGYEYLPSLEAFAGTGRHHLSLMYTPVDYSGSRVLSQDVVFRGKTYTAGVPVETDLKFMMLDLEYQVDIINMENLLAG